MAILYPNFGGLQPEPLYELGPMHVALLGGRWPSLANADFGDGPLLLWSSNGSFSPPARWGKSVPD